jgi:hypothetical protein
MKRLTRCEEERVMEGMNNEEEGMDGLTFFSRCCCLQNPK